MHSVVTRREAAIFICAVFLFGAWYSYSYSSETNFHETEAGFDPAYESDLRAAGFEPAEFKNEPREKPRVGIQAGHWKSHEAPDELEPLRRRTGAEGGGVSEASAVLAIAEHVKAQLEEKGVDVDLIPATVPPRYRADAFVSIHADGNPNTKARGFKIGSPYRDASGIARELESKIYDSYAAATGLPIDHNITRAMRGYYAFNWRRYDHSIHPLTPAVIVETGFITNPTDRAFLTDEAARAARGVSDGIIEFLEEGGSL